jgi:hypothetical protein
MIVALLAAAAFIDRLPVLVVCIVAIGFSTGFYIVPLFTLLQAKAPKQSKGEMIATSNCVNVTGAIAATLLFKVVVAGAHLSGLAPPISGREELGAGALTELKLDHGRPAYFEVETPAGVIRAGNAPTAVSQRSLGEVLGRIVTDSGSTTIVQVHKAIPIPPNGVQVEVSRFELAGVTHYDVVPMGVPPATDYDNRQLPRYLFMGAALFTMLLLLSIVRPVAQLRHELAREPVAH